MKRKNLKEGGLRFSFSELPADYPYRYTLQYILSEKFGRKGRVDMVNQLTSELGIKRRALECYIYARREDEKYYIMSDAYLAIVARELGVEVAMLTVDMKKMAS